MLVCIAVPNIKSAIKRARTADKSKLRNLSIKTRVKSAMRAVIEARKAKNTDEIGKKMSTAFSVIDKAVKRKVIHKNTASRYKSRLSKMLAKAV